jgi:hypothetical protein
MLGITPLCTRPLCSLWQADIFKSVTVTVPVNASNQTGFPYLFSINVPSTGNATLHKPGYVVHQVVVKQSGTVIPSQLISASPGFAQIAVRLNLSSSTTETLTVSFR